MLPITSRTREKKDVRRGKKITGSDANKNANAAHHPAVFNDRRRPIKFAKKISDVGVASLIKFERQTIKIAR
ncbi:MAG: hypothetical protein SPL62_03845 [Selenomonas sp.]|nr:hypothetical protein [Selenomonas sp.]MDY6349616.1 hypothetical protein [Selenomonas sp.]